MSLRKGNNKKVGYSGKLTSTGRRADRTEKVTGDRSPNPFGSDKKKWGCN